MEAANPPTLPRIGDLTAESDLSAFLRRGVPEALKNAALRRMWSLDPAIRDFVGPADYAWDFNDPASMAGFGAAASSPAAALIHPFSDASSRKDGAAAEPNAAGKRAPASDAAEASGAPSPPLGPDEHSVAVSDGASDENPPPPPPSMPETSVNAQPPNRRHGGALPE